MNRRDALKRFAGSGAGVAAALAGGEAFWQTFGQPTPLEAALLSEGETASHSQAICGRTGRRPVLPATLVAVHRSPFPGAARAATLAIRLPPITAGGRAVIRRSSRRQPPSAVPATTVNQPYIYTLPRLR